MPKLFHKIQWATFGFLSFCSSISFGADLFLKNLSEDQFQKIIQDFSGVFVHAPLTGASGSAIFGFELGLVAGVVKTKNLQEVVASVSPDQQIDSFPHAGVTASISVPFGLTGEIVFLPAYDAEGVNFKTSSIGIKWTLTQNLLKLPFDFALRLHHSESDFQSTQPSTFPGMDVLLNFKNTITGLQALISKSFFIFEPYVGFGLLSSSGQLSLDGSTGDSLFDSTFSLSDSAEDSVSGSQIFVGLAVDLFLIQLAVEAGQIFGEEKVSAKIAIGF